MMSAKFSGFWTPSLPLVSARFMQPPFLSSEIGSPSLLTSFMYSPLKRLHPREAIWSILSQKLTIVDNCHKNSKLLIIVTIGNDCHHYSRFSKFPHLSQLPFIKIGHSFQNWSKFLLLIRIFTIICNCSQLYSHNYCLSQSETTVTTF